MVGAPADLSARPALGPRRHREAVAATREAMTEVLGRWGRGVTAAPEFDAVIAHARATYAEFVGVTAADVAIGHQVSPLVAFIAASLPPGAEVWVPDGEFISVTFPFAVQPELRVRQVPLADLADQITGDTSLVALAAVQSAGGQVADLDALELAAARHDADILLDLTQATGWLPVDASRFAYTVCGTYKWLLSPRGTAFLTVRGDRLEAILPAQANWYAGAQPWDSIYGLPLRLAPDARRFDVSPGWFSWVGTAASLDFLAGIGAEALHAHAIEVKAAFADAAGLAAVGRAIVSLDADEQTPRTPGPRRHHGKRARRPTAARLPCQQHDRGGGRRRRAATRARPALIRSRRAAGSPWWPRRARRGPRPRQWCPRGRWGRPGSGIPGLASASARSSYRRPLRVPGPR